MPTSFRQVFILCLCACVLQSLAGQFNHMIASFAVTLDLAGLLIAFAALRLPFGPALTVALFTGLWVDAYDPVSFGRHAFLYGLAVCMINQFRGRLPREETFVCVVTALFVNLALCVAAGFLDLGSLPDAGAGALRLLADLVASQLATALIGPWFIALQLRSLQLVRAEPVSAIRRYA
jgi:rod shape-determining protein MreD